MGNIDVANVEAGLFSLLALFLPWLRPGRRRFGSSCIALSNIHLNRRWGRPDRQLHQERKAKVVQEVLRCIHQSGLNLVDPQLLEDIGGHLEAAEQKAAEVVPGAHTSWLVLLVLAEAMQFMALPFAAAIGWDDSFILGFVPQAFRLGLPQHNNGKLFEVLLWVVLSPMLVLLSLAVLGGLLGLLSGFTQSVHWMGSQLPRVLSEGCYLTIRISVGLYTRLQELVVEFGVMFMFSTMLLVFLCSGSAMHSLPNVQCWKGLPHILYVSLAILQLLLHFCAIFSNNLPLYSIRWLWSRKSGATADNRENPEKYFPKDDYMVFLSEAALYDASILSASGIQVFEIDRPVFSSWWSASSGMLKFLAAAVFVFFGNKDGCQWVLLSVGGLCYVLLLFMNIWLSPCTYHWINCSRSMSLVAGLWAVVCGFASAGIDNINSSSIELAFIAGILVIAIALPGVLLYGFRSVQADLQSSEPLRCRLLHSYEKMVVLFRLMSMRMTPDGVVVEGGNSIGLYMIKGLDVVRPTGSLFQVAVKRLKADAEEWSAWTKQDAGLGVACCCPCCVWLPLAVAEDNSVSDTVKALSKSHWGAQHIPGGCELLGAATRKVKLWMESADLIVDPERDIELGLNVPLDAYFTFDDGLPKYTGDCPHNLSLLSTSLSSAQIAADASPSAACSGSPWIRHGNSRDQCVAHYRDEGPSHRQLNALTVQAIERAYDGNEPPVPIPQTAYPGVEKPQSSAFGLEGVTRADEMCRFR